MKTALTKELQDHLDQDVNEYINNSGISGAGVWTTNAEIMATANLLSCDIIIHTKFDASMDRLTYPASLNLN